MSNVIPFPVPAAKLRLEKHVVLLKSPLIDLRSAEKCFGGSGLGCCWLTPREPDTILLNSVARAATGCSTPIQWHHVKSPFSGGGMVWLGVRVG